jgi:hypothetical protein
VAAPDSYPALVAPLPDGVEFVRSPGPPLDLIHLFVTTSVDLRRKLQRYRPMIEPAGMIWVSWPKQAAKVPTDVTEDVIREIALGMGLVDIKVCAVDAVWSGLKLVVRKELRG